MNGKPICNAASALLSQFLLLVLSLLAWADDPPGDCGTTDTDLLLNISVIDPRDTLVIGRLIFVTFPDLPAAEQEVPEWADDAADEMGNFIHDMSRGQQEIIASVIRRPAPNQNLAWMADSVSLYYSDVESGSSRFAELNRQIIEDIGLTYPGVWQTPDTVEAVFIMHYRCTWHCSSHSADSCDVTCENTGKADDGQVSSKGVEIG
jgi:hypothetical protein